MPPYLFIHSEVTWKCLMSSERLIHNQLQRGLKMEQNRDVAAANLELVRLIVNKTLEGRLTWERTPTNVNLYKCNIPPEMACFLEVEGELATSTEWSRLILQQGSVNLVTVSYPNQRAQSFGLPVASEEMKIEIGKIFNLLRTKAFDSTYGKALQQLKAV